MDAFRRGDMEEGLRGCDPEIEFEPLRSAVEGGYRGHEGMRAFWKDSAESFELFEPDCTDVPDLGDRCLLIGTIRVRGRGSGVETDIPTGAIASFRDGLLVRYEDFGVSDRALEAAGLGGGPSAASSD